MFGVEEVEVDVTSSNESWSLGIDGESKFYTKPVKNRYFRVHICWKLFYFEIYISQKTITGTTVNVPGRGSWNYTYRYE